MILINNVQKNELTTLIELWEASVKATHSFLPEQAINELKPLILNEYFSMVTLFCSRDEQQTITGFAGINEHKLEMLFIDPEQRGKGIGKALLNYAINEFNITEVDVNEQNPQAVGFYQHLGFKVISRSPTDGQGNPYPLLHMRYQP